MLTIPIRWHSSCSRGREGGMRCSHQSCVSTNKHNQAQHRCTLYFHSSGLIICICHTNLAVLLHRTVKVCLPARDRFIYLIPLSPNLACQGIDYSWLLRSAGQSLSVLVCRPKPQRMLELASACSQLETDTGKLENSGKHLTSFFSWLGN